MGPVGETSPAFLLTPDEIAYNTVKEAKAAVLAGLPKPDRCSPELWQTLMEMYGKANR